LLLSVRHVSVESHRRSKVADAVTPRRDNMIEARRWYDPHRVLTCALALGSLATLLLVSYGPVLFGGRQFGYRDAAHYYYPLYQKVQREWDEGRWPLWEREENAGMPLLGNPTAAVLYPGKLIYALFPYAWAARVYIIAHTVLAFATMLVLMRSWRASGTASTSSALGYAFAAPILFQSCNVIYLVGAAWLPLGFHAADQWARLGRRWGLFEMAVVLAMQTLGGDPQSSYLLGCSAGGYAAAIAWCRAKNPRGARIERNPRSSSRQPGRWAPALLLVALVVWFSMTVILGTWLPKLRPPGLPGQPSPLAWMASIPLAVFAAWVLGGLGFLLYWRRRGWRFPLGIAWLGLAFSALLAMAVSAAQLLPVIEFIRQTQRAGSAETSDVYSFSLEPFRLVEMVWPNVFGVYLGEQSHWYNALPLPGTRPQIWAPSLYCGGLILVLGLSAISVRRGPPWRIWLSVVAIVGLAGSLGQYTSPIWMTRAVATAMKSSFFEDAVRDLGALDPAELAPLRADGYLRDGDGSLYWWLTQVLPGFRQFRFPSKLFSFTVLALAALAGLGWDSLNVRRSRRMVMCLSVLIALSLALMACAVWMRPAILAALRAVDINSMHGPFNPLEGFAAIVHGLTQAAVVLGLGLAAVVLVNSRRRLAGAIAIAVTTADLAVANARFVVTVPQAQFDSQPEVLKIIEAAEHKQPAGGPYRIHRTGFWAPLGWNVARSADRVVEINKWEIDTIQSKFGINRGAEYTLSMGVGELDEYRWFFQWFRFAVDDPEMARSLQIAVDQPIVYFPRRSFDIWNTRYFVVPFDHAGWNDERRGYASFVYHSEVIYPPPDAFRGPQGEAEYQRWTASHDFRVLRNNQELPRAWIVHSARIIPTLTGSAQDDGWKLMQEMIYCNDLWRSPNLRVFDPRVFAWMDRDTLRGITRYLPASDPRPTETVKVAYPNPQRVELEATLNLPGLVILSDVYYPGWELTIDDRPARINKVNRLMRGAAVDQGKHRLVYAYNPRSFLAGRISSFAGVTILMALGVICALWPVDKVVAGIDLPM
jgi:hypothetical protein